VSQKTVFLNFNWDYITEWHLFLYSWPIVGWKSWHWNLRNPEFSFTFARWPVLLTLRRVLKCMNYACESLRYITETQPFPRASCVCPSRY
jgi:hypothetical protein